MGYVKYILVMLTGLITAMSADSKSLTAHVFTTPDQIELSEITNAGHYILATHLVRTLTKLDKLGNVQPNLLKKWTKISSKQWLLELDNLRFSNGEQIKSDDVISSIKRQMKIANAIHYNFNNFKTLKKIADRKIVITLNKENSNLIYDFSKPEFGVLHRTDYLVPKNQMKFKITSGPYSIKNIKFFDYYLTRNTYYSNDVENDFDLVFLRKHEKNSTNFGLDFYATAADVSQVEHLKLTKLATVKATKPHVGFSYWVSLNKNSKIFKNKTSIRKFQNHVSNFDINSENNFLWEKANQLYLPDGDGRPTTKEIEKVWKDIKLDSSKLKESKVKPVLRMLPLKFSNNVIVDLIKHLSLNYNVEIISYKTEEELRQIISRNEFDIKISANDFSSIDLSENLKTSFNSSRPYIFLKKNDKIFKLMSDLSKEEVRSIRSAIFKEIGLRLISEGYIAPVGFQRIWFYSSREVDIANWSNLFPEVSFWKVKLSDTAGK